MKIKSLCISFVLTVCVFRAAGAFAAGWVDEFVRVQRAQGIQSAIEYGLSEGIHVDALVGEALKLDGFTKEELITAFYCADVSGADIRSAAIDSGISDVDVVAGYRRSVRECDTGVAETMIDPLGTISNLAGGFTFASPSTF